MMYDFNPYIIRSVLREFAEDQERLHGRRTIAVYPGISHLQLARSGALAASDWVFFDLTLARDLKFERQPVEDLDFEPE